MLDLLPTVAPHPNFTQRELAYSVLLHDIAKPETFTQSGDRESISFPDHEALGARKADEITAHPPTRPRAQTGGSGNRDALSTLCQFDHEPSRCAQTDRCTELISYSNYTA